MGSGCGYPTVEKFPSSSGQLPVPVALNARLPTLFGTIIAQNVENVNTEIYFVSRAENEM